VNDSDRRYSSGGFDDDAIFADIVAHMNDDLTEKSDVTETSDLTDRSDVTETETDPADGPIAGPISEPTSEPGAKDGPTDTGVADQPADRATDQAVDKAADPATGPSLDQAPESIDLPWAAGPLGDPRRWSVNLPPGSPSEDPALTAPQVWRAHEVDDEFEDHFEPPPISPLPAGDLQFWAIIAGMAGGPLLLLYLVFFNRDASSYWILTAIALSVGGFALLVSRMPGGQQDDDDGARL
jgi:hypothetical protein